MSDWPLTRKFDSGKVPHCPLGITKLGFEKTFCGVPVLPSEANEVAELFHCVAGNAVVEILKPRPGHGFVVHVAQHPSKLE